jgi:hypothetical protein
MNICTTSLIFQLIDTAAGIFFAFIACTIDLIGMEAK